MSAPTTAADDFADALREDLNKFHPQGNDAGKEGRRQLGRWRRALCSSRGPDSTCRLVGLVLVAHMLNPNNPAPSQECLKIETGLGVRTIGETLRRMVAQHWLVVISKRPGRGAVGQGLRYACSIPQKAHGVRRSSATAADLSSISRTTKPSSLGAKTPSSMPRQSQIGIVGDVAIQRVSPC